ncbi:hypothetical protein ACFQ1H_00545 [Scardovia wiggsiae]|uniref:hypothetical protein n=1 Tax=Scardovia wiggsiae TaxID=230143 RepID=UPI00363D2785
MTGKPLAYRQHSSTVFLRTVVFCICVCIMLSACSKISGGQSSRAIGHSYFPGDPGYTLADGVDDTDMRIGLVGACCTHGAGDNVMQALSRELSQTYAVASYSPIACTESTSSSDSVRAQVAEIDSYLERHVHVIVVHPQAATDPRCSRADKAAFARALEKVRTHRTAAILVNTSEQQAKNMGIGSEYYAALWNISVEQTTQSGSSQPGTEQRPAPAMRPLDVIRAVIDDTPHATVLRSVINKHKTE